MTVVLLTIAGALILIWGAIAAIMKWVHPIEQKHLLGYAGYVSVVSGMLIYLVVHTSMVQQEAALEKTRARLNQELENFREKLGEVQVRVMSQLEEKAELTQSEWQIRGELQTERAEHTLRRKELAETAAELLKETEAHRAYLDSLNTERSVHRGTRRQLEREVQKHEDTQQALRAIRESLSKAEERLTVQKGQISSYKKDLKQAETRTRQALENAREAQVQLLQRAINQQSSLDVLQAAIDSIYGKVLKRPRLPVAPQ
ncbi:MAG: hypothetical protein QGI83_15900 [Candidatus Latescibacteria bacterium]|jgi:chromosome segregation ATPase|nr:hypothetical protein [Candidatus Latescibacterota bacterium]